MDEQSQLKPQYAHRSQEGDRRTKRKRLTIHLRMHDIAHPLRVLPLERSVLLSLHRQLILRHTPDLKQVLILDELVECLPDEFALVLEVLDGLEVGLALLEVPLDELVALDGRGGGALGFGEVEDD